MLTPDTLSPPPTCRACKGSGVDRETDLLCKTCDGRGIAPRRERLDRLREIAEAAGGGLLLLTVCWLGWAAVWLLEVA